MTSAAAVHLSAISKHFGRVVALDRVDFEFQPGRVHALLGENGAGKSTLMAIAAGLLRPDDGLMTIDGRPVRLRSPREAIRAGVGIVQQHFSLVPALTVAENVAIGGHGWFDPGNAAKRVRTAAESVGLEVDPHAVVAELPVQAQQRVEIVRAIAFGARTLILDEPSAVLAPDEIRTLLDWIRRFAADGGSIALVTHKVPEALAVADEITVLRGGRRAAHARVGEWSSESLAGAMFAGATPASGPRPRRPLTDKPGVAAAREVVLPTPVHGSTLHGVTLELHAGEIVGVVGVEGSGHADLLRAFAGLIHPVSGTLQVPDAVSFVPADRHRDAMILDFPLFENFTLRHAGSRRGTIDWTAQRQSTRDVMRDFQVHAETESVPARTLSGGNQQRFVLGRELAAAPELLVLENPTRGLDLLATGVLHERIVEAAANGVAVLVYSSDLEEVLMLADRVVVAYDGAVREVAPRYEIVARAMVGQT